MWDLLSANLKIARKKQLQFSKEKRKRLCMWTIKVGCTCQEYFGFYGVSGSSERWTWEMRRLIAALVPSKQHSNVRVRFWFVDSDIALGDRLQLQPGSKTMPIQMRTKKSDYRTVMNRPQPTERRSARTVVFIGKCEVSSSRIQTPFVYLVKEEFQLFGTMKTHNIFDYLAMYNPPSLS